MSYFPNWWPKDADATRKFALEIHKSENNERLFELLVIAAAAGQWDVFYAALEELTQISKLGIEAMLEHVDEASNWLPLYATAKLPKSLYPYFIEVIRASVAAPPSSDGNLRTNEEYYKILSDAFVKCGVDITLVSMRELGEILQLLVIKEKENSDWVI